LNRSDRHLAFEDGYFYRLRADGQHQLIHGGAALLLRPSDAGLMLRVAVIYMMRAGFSERARELCDEMSEGVQRLAEVAAEASYSSAILSGGATGKTKLASSRAR
jgi:hypothetical protein